MPARIPGVKRNKHGHILCKHSMAKYICKRCDGVSICKHGRNRYICKDCGGNGICEHGKRRTRCPSCSPSVVFEQYRHDAKERKYQFKLSFKEYLRISDRPCTYCGDREVRNGIDRKNNLNGYTSKNSVPCCSKCNWMKKTYTVEEFLNHIERVHGFQQSKRRKE